MFFLFAPAKCHLLSLLNGAGRLKCFLRGGDSRSVVGYFLGGIDPVKLRTYHNSRKPTQLVV